MHILLGRGYVYLVFELTTVWMNDSKLPDRSVINGEILGLECFGVTYKTNSKQVNNNSLWKIVSNNQLIISGNLEFCKQTKNNLENFHKNCA